MRIPPRMTCILCGFVSQIAWAQGQPQPPVTGAESASTSSDVTSSLMDFVKVRDPFRQLRGLSEEDAPKTELQRYGVNEFRMIGVVTGMQKSRALISLGDERTFLVSEGMDIGQRKGKIVKVTKDMILVREKVMNVMGQEENLDTEIRLQPELAQQGGGS